MMSFNNYPQQTGKTIVLSEAGKHQRIQPNEILFIQADHVYVKIVLINGQTALYRSSLEQMSKRLPQGRFLRVHRSYIINTNHVLRWDRNQVILTGQTIPISRSRAKEIKHYLLSA